VREVAEETGLDIRLGPPLSTQRYWVENGERRIKRVYYWVGRVVGDEDVSSYRVNNEIDEVAWFPVEKARRRMDYDYDRATLEEFERLRKKSYPLVILRHGRAKARKSWTKDDRERPLTKAGEFQAEQVVPVLGAYGVTHVLSSSSRRCWSTVAPYADVAHLEIEDTEDLSQEDATSELVAKHVQALLNLKEASVLCAHRPVLPWAYEALGLTPNPLAPGALSVVHHRRGRVVAVEQHDVTFQ
jgi:8-oxo-dGTP diphosphatase